MSGAQVMFRVTYARASELRDDIAQQMALGGLLIKVDDASGLTFDTPVSLTLILPDGTALQTPATVLQVLAGFGIAVSIAPALVDQARRAASGPDAAGAGPARHERHDRPERTERTERAERTERTERSEPGALPSASPAPSQAPAPSTPPEPTPERTLASRSDGPTRSEKIQKALHGTRDERNAILRDRDRSLHPFVLKNPQLDADDALAIAKNAQMTPDLLKLIGDRKDWFQRPVIALALARNPKTPPELAVRALEHISTEALRQLAKGIGVLPHVTHAARKKLLG